MPILQQKTFIITGASMGVGRAVALAMAAQGANLVLNARAASPESALGEVWSACEDMGVRASFVAGDASRHAVVSDIMEEALRLGNFAGFIHAAGVFHPGPYLWELEESAFLEVFASSVTAAYQLVRLAVPVLVAKGEGLAVFFGSGAGSKAQPGIAAYSAAKAAEEHLARLLAEEAPEVTTVIFQPGIVDTRMQRQAREASGGASDDVRRVFVPWKEQGLLLTPEESAQALLRLLQGDAGAYHGRTVRPEEIT